MVSKGIEYKGITKPKKTKEKKQRISYKETYFIPFGKFVLNIDRLNRENILLIKYPKNNGPTLIKRTSITDDFKNLINDLLDTNIINTDLQKELNEKEQDLFHSLLKKAGLDLQLNYKRISKTVEDYKNRFEILRGALIAGNNSDDIINELKDIILLLSNKSVNVISETDAKMLIDCLN